MINPVREKAFEIIKKAQNVKINEDKIKDFSKENFIIPEWDNFYHFNSLDYFLILDSINFCFWNEGKRWEIEYKGKKYNGYYALALTLKKFFEERSPNLGYFVDISRKEFNSILQEGKNLYFLEERWEIVKAVSREVIKRYGNFDNLIKSADKKLSDLVPKIQKLPYFEDPFLKRAQILPCDVYGSGLTDFEDLDYLTIFADYKVPQILEYLGILEYSDPLNEKINEKILILEDSEEEKEIRAGTIWAVELLKRELNYKFHSFEIDWILWNKAQDMKIDKPYHLTKTIRY